MYKSNSKKPTILSLEQALALPYATQRFVQLGWRVIRIELPSAGGESKSGDPNRYIGEDTGIEDLHSYYIAPNIGKEAITLNLKSKQGQALLKTLIKELHVDIFMCNTLPKRYKQLGIDFETLKGANPNLIWCGISAFGLDNPNGAGYDPALQAFTGFMHLTGDPESEPMLCGLPIIDLKAGDEAYSQVLLALWEEKSKLNNEEKPIGGKEIFISMAQCAASWLITALPQLQFVKNEAEIFTRSGYEHRSFVPSNCYPTKDGHVYLAIGNDLQWDKLTKISGFEHLYKVERINNQSRSNDKENIYADIRKGLQNYTANEFIEVCKSQNLAVAPVNTTLDVSKLDLVSKNMMKTTLPNGKEISLFPAPITTDFLKENDFKFTCAPRLGENNNSIYTEVGCTVSQIEELILNKII